MFNIIIYICMVAFLLKCNAIKLHGEEFEKAAKILHIALHRLKEAIGDIYTARSVEAAYKFIPNEVFTYKISVLDWRKDEKKCMMTITYSFGQYNAEVIIKCDGEAETTKKIVNQLLIPK